MDGRIKLTPDQLRSLATDFQAKSANVLDILYQLNDQVFNLESVWDGAARAIYFDEYRMLQDPLKQFPQALDGIARTLEQVANTFEESDHALAQGMQTGIHTSPDVATASTQTTNQRSRNSINNGVAPLSSSEVHPRLERDMQSGRSEEPREGRFEREMRNGQSQEQREERSAQRQERREERSARREQRREERTTRRVERRGRVFDRAMNLPFVPNDPRLESLFRTYNHFDLGFYEQSQAFTNRQRAEPTSWDWYDREFASRGIVRYSYEHHDLLWERDAYVHFLWSLNNARSLGRDNANMILSLYEVEDLVNREEYQNGPSILSGDVFASRDTVLQTRMGSGDFMDVWNNRVGVELAQFSTSSGYTDEELFLWARDQGLLITHPAQVYDRLYGMRIAPEDLPRGSAIPVQWDFSGYDMRFGIVDDNGNLVTTRPITFPEIPEPPPHPQPEHRFRPYTPPLHMPHLDAQ